MEGCCSTIHCVHTVQESLRVGVHFVYKCGLFGCLSTELSGLFVVPSAVVMSAAPLLLDLVTTTPDTTGIVMLHTDSLREREREKVEK